MRFGRTSFPHLSVHRSLRSPVAVSIRPSKATVSPRLTGGGNCNASQTESRRAEALSRGIRNSEFLILPTPLSKSAFNSRKVERSAPTIDQWEGGTVLDLRNGCVSTRRIPTPSSRNELWNFSAMATRCCSQFGQCALPSIPEAGGQHGSAKHSFLNRCARRYHSS